jgi:uncharacterized protein YqcC (DUF446 family)
LDTLDPEQWLQWVFIPKIRVLIEQNQSLPSGFAIAPYFEQVWQDRADCQRIILVAQKIDEAVKQC